MSQSAAVMRDAVVIFGAVSSDPDDTLKSMVKAPGEDRRLTKLSKICMGLPEAVREVCGAHAGFSVRKKTFAWFLFDHHGDGIVAVSCKVLPGDNARLAAADPKRFYLPAYMASRGWVALRLDLGGIDWEEVTDLVTGSYQLIAPKKLAELVKQKD